MIMNKMKMDLQRCEITRTVDVVQGDILSRTLEISLHAGGEIFLLPQNLAVLIRYKKADGKGGEFDTLPTGESAWFANKNTLTIILAPQMLTFPGEVNVTVTLLAAGVQLSTFPLRLYVYPAAQAWSEDSEDYFNITGFLIAPGPAAVGQYLRVCSVNSDARVTGIEAVSPAIFSGGVQSDWNAGMNDPGHVLNRPFYSETATTTILAETNPAFIEEESSFMISEAMAVSAGMKCTVSWNGVEYTCTAQDASVLTGVPGTTVLGNCADLGEGFTGNGEPFIIMVLPVELVAEMGAGGQAMPLDGVTELTLSIIGHVETVTPIPKKYLTNARAQKPVIIDLDTLTASISLEEAAAMDTGELQAVTTVIYEGAEHSASVVDRLETEINGTPFYNLRFAVHHVPETAGYGVVKFSWNSAQGIEVGDTTTTIPPYKGNNAAPAFFVKLPSNTGGEWYATESIPLNGILLKSSGGKQFWITVNESGVLTAVEKN